MFPLRDRQPSYSKPAVTIFIIVVNRLVFLFEFSLDDYKLAYDATSTGERLVPGSVPNAFPRAIWPES